jgi:hypothetical protein
MGFQRKSESMPLHEAPGHTSLSCQYRMPMVIAWGSLRSLRQ